LRKVTSTIQPLHLKLKQVPEDNSRVFEIVVGIKIAYLLLLAP